MSVWALIMAAGSGARMGLGHNKVLAPLAGMPVLARSAAAFNGLVDGKIIVTRAEDMEAVRAMLPSETVVRGGKTRQQSVLRGLEALPARAEIVLVHDAARPLVTRRVIERCIASARAHGSGVAGVPVKDTIKRVDSHGAVWETPPRAALRAAQTPQAFGVVTLRAAIEALEARGEIATDDAAAIEASGGTVYMVEGAETNLKLTTPEDLRMAEWMLGDGPRGRVGHGYDAHRLVAGRPLILCGVTIPYEKGLLGYSDADVATHALMDALLGAAALGDIGCLFPDNDPAYKGISSMLLLRKVARLLREKGFSIGNADVTIVAQRPKLSPYRDAMVRAVAAALTIPPAAVNIKATTTEGLGFEGEGLGICAFAVSMIHKCP
ncbi:MAG: 2-C-methyl-D-erythritol 4-phosphate cytidylyltransferase [Firmicutes bacterium]|nr:2-C-methyl-D-erythritol 4-phosphate cytidylyltransferase [Bacillota bacterium]